MQTDKSPKRRQSQVSKWEQRASDAGGEHGGWEAWWFLRQSFIPTQADLELCSPCWALTHSDRHSSVSYILRGRARAPRPALDRESLHVPFTSSGEGLKLLNTHQTFEDSG